MLFGIHVLDVKKNKIQKFGAFEHDVLFGEAAGLHTGTYITGTCLPQEGQCEICLQERLTAGQGHAAARAGVEGSVLFDDLEDFIHRLFFAVNIKCVSDAGLSAGHGASLAERTVNTQGIVFLTDKGATRADFQAVLAFVEPYAAFFIESELRLMEL